MTRPPRLVASIVAWCIPVLLAGAPPARASEPQPGPPLSIARATGPITADGDLSDAGWQGVAPVTVWFETRVGDNIEPQVKNVAYLAYDDQYFYAAFRFEDPEPGTIRAPLGDHDAVPSSTDYAGVIVDSRNDGKTAQMFLANPRGVQYDAISSDATGEDNAPDFFWDSAGRIGPDGWTLEIRIPFSSLRYANLRDQTWGILLYRNYPRDRRYQFFSARLPRDVNCFICNSSKITGLSQLPHGSHLVVAPYGTTEQAAEPETDLGTPLENGDVQADGGVDVKWNPGASLAIDATLNPDFSQIESDVAQIVANERFALFFPEKRPFFLEGVDLFSTVMTAVYTRTITSPRGGLRATGRLGSTSYTALLTQDRGGGVVILPGPQGSGTADQDFRSNVGVVRLRHDLGPSFVSLLGTAREIEDDGGYNRVFGPDFQWRPRPTDSFTGQALWSETETPQRTDLSDQWDGRRLSDHAVTLYWSHATPTFDWFLQGQDIGPDFRADNGFIPQVGYREAYLDLGYTIRPQDAFMNRIRFWTTNYADVEPGGDLLNRRVSAGVGMDGAINSFVRIELNHDDIRVGDELLQRFRPRVFVESSPGRVLNYVSLDSYFGEEIDFSQGREGTGATLIGTLIFRPSDHLELRANASRRWIDIDDASGSGRLLTAEVERLRATWSFSSRSFLRLIGQYTQTRRDLALFPPPPDQPAEKEASFTGSALFAYKLNWQTVFYAGYGDQRTFLDVSDDLEPAGRQVFLKISYAWQR